MPKITYRDAVRMALADEMRRPQSDFLWRRCGCRRGVFKVTPACWKNLATTVRDTPIFEQAIIGAGLGAALTGLRPSS
jgi:pyruvate dehydrogenase E1 component beta subunit